MNKHWTKVHYREYITENKIFFNIFDIDRIRLYDEGNGFFKFYEIEEIPEPYLKLLYNLHGREIEIFDVHSHPMDMISFFKIDITKSNRELKIRDILE